MAFGTLMISGSEMVEEEPDGDEYTRSTERISGSETSVCLEYHWWLVDDIPGDLVKYEYRQFDNGEEDVISGELVAIDNGYVTRLDAC